VSELKVTIAVDESVSLEAAYSPLEGARGAAVVLHPHPNYGGSMDNNVVWALTRGALAAGWSALRFNFRGVGRSTGRHGGGAVEAEDVLAVAGWLAQRQKGPLALMGYSFGSLVGSLAAARLTGLACGLWASPPLVLGELSPWPAQAGPLLIMVGSADEFTDVGRLEAYCRQTGARCRLEVSKGGDHFWWGGESVLTQASRGLLLSASGPAAG